MNSLICASEIRTKASAMLLRDISIAEMHGMLIDLFVDRILLEKEIQENIKPPFDVGVFLTREYKKYEYCYATFTEPQVKDFYETQYGFDESELIFIEDGGANNEW